MATLTVQTVTLDGVATSYAAATAGGDEFANDGRTWLEVVNAHATLSRTVTVNSLQTCSHGSDHNPAVVVAALSTARIGPFNPHRFNASSGRVGVTYSDSGANLTVAAVKLGATVP